MSKVSRVEKLEQAAKMVNKKSKVNNYSKKLHDRSLTCLYEALIKMANNPQVKTIKVESKEDPIIERLVKGALDYIEKKEKKAVK